jgi:hypothetical protein
VHAQAAAIYRRFILCCTLLRSVVIALEFACMLLQKAGLLHFAHRPYRSPPVVNKSERHLRPKQQKKKQLDQVHSTQRVILNWVPASAVAAASAFSNRCHRLQFASRRLRPRASVLVPAATRYGNAGAWMPRHKGR